MSRIGGGRGGGRSGDDSLPDRLRSSLTVDGNKPDSTRLSESGSPRSPLRTRPSASSSSSSSGSLGVLQNPTRRSDSNSGQKSHSGELSGSSDSSPSATARPGHRRSGSGPLLYTGGGGSSTASSPATNVLPAGNICPSGRIGKGGMVARPAARKDVLGSGKGNYGHGSIMRGGTSSLGGGKPSHDSSRASAVAVVAGDPHEVTRVGNECYKKGNLEAALSYYDRAVEICPGNAACRNNRAAALMGLGRLAEAVKECEEAVRLDPACGRAHHRLAMLHLRLGQVETSMKHLYMDRHQPNPDDLRKLQEVEKHLGRCADSRKVGDWKGALRDADAAIAAGADSCSLLIAARAEALLRLHQLVEADSALSSLPKIMTISPACWSNKFGMVSESYVCIVQAQVEMALGRFESAVTAAEKAHRMDLRSVEVAEKLNTVQSVTRARAQGNELYKSGNFAEASTAYAEGLKYDPLNPVLYCNRAACRSKLNQWDRTIADCNEALMIHPSYVKPLLRRADSYAKLERWAEAVRDYEALRKGLPNDMDVAESLFHAQVALKSSRGEDVSNMKFGGEVEEITGVEQFQASISLTGVSVVYFMDPSSEQCANISPFVDVLCTRHPSLNFLKVNRSKSPAVADAESVRIVPTFKIYKNGAKLKEMVCPSKTLLQHSVRHYDLR